MLFSTAAAAGKYDYFSDRFKAAYKWLAETDLDSLKEGSYPITDGVTANVQEYNTKSPSEGRFEAHDRFFDIQYMIAGRERFGICKREGLKVHSVDAENDLIFYEEPDFSGDVCLFKGDMIVVSPDDAHKPRLIMGSTPEPVRKIVVKVKV
jgi:biofilm protein TabA